MLTERKDVCAAMPDNTNQTPQLSALSGEHDAVVSIPRVRRNINCAPANRGSLKSPPPITLAVTQDECVV